MKKKNRITLILVIVLMCFAVAVYINRRAKKAGTLNTELSDFAVSDTASITKIFIADKSNASVILERMDDHWMVNNNVIARKDAIDLLLRTIREIKVKAPVPKAAYNTIVKNLSSGGLKVEIYQDKELSKTYYVGHATQDQRGTYMLLEGSSVPFIMHIERFTGYLTSRYFINELLWQAPNVFSYSFNEIKSIKVEHFVDDRKSFKVHCNGNNSYDLESLDDSSMVAEFDTVEVKFFIAQFRNLNYDQNLTKIEDHKKDSILASQPAHIITVEDIEGNVKSLKAFIKKNPIGVNPKTGEKNPVNDVDIMYGNVNDDEVLLIQYFVFDPILVGLSYFTVNN